jgi:hypothetical protein
MPIEISTALGRLHARKLVAAGALLAGAAAGAGAAASAQPPERPVRAFSFVPRSRGDWTRPHRKRSAARRGVHGGTQTAAHTSSGASHGYTIPASIVMCESGGNYSAVNPSSGAGGAYQILPSTWAAYGGTGLPQDAPPAVQDAIAAKIYAAGGPSQWSCG